VKLGIYTTRRNSDKTQGKEKSFANQQSELRDKLPRSYQLEDNDYFPQISIRGNQLASKAQLKNLNGPKLLLP